MNFARDCEGLRVFYEGFCGILSDFKLIRAIWSGFEGIWSGF